MTKHPEKIFATVNGASTDVLSGRRGLIGGWHEHPRDFAQEYVRADLADPAMAELRDALKLAAARLQRLGIELPSTTTLRADAFDWAAEALRVLDKGER